MAKAAQELARAVLEDNEASHVSSLAELRLIHGAVDKLSNETSRSITSALSAVTDSSALILKSEAAGIVRQIADSMNAAISAISAGNANSRIQILQWAITNASIGSFQYCANRQQIHQQVSSIAIVQQILLAFMKGEALYVEGTFKIKKKK